MLYVWLAVWGGCQSSEIPVRTMVGPVAPPPSPVLTPDIRVPFPSQVSPELLPIGDVDGDGVPELGIGRNLGDIELGVYHQVITGILWLDGRPILSIDSDDYRYLDTMDGNGFVSMMYQMDSVMGPVDIDGDGVHDIVTREHVFRGCLTSCAWGERQAERDTYPIRGLNEPRDPVDTDGVEPDIDTSSPCEETCDASFTRFSISYGGRDEVAVYEVPSDVHEHRLLDVDADGDDDLVVRRARQLAWVASRDGGFSGRPVPFVDLNGLFNHQHVNEVRVLPLMELAGDLNGDGYEDLAVREVDGLMVEDLAVFQGGPQGPTLMWQGTDFDLQYLSTMGSIDPMGDVNGDGYDDLGLFYNVDGHTLLAMGGPTGVAELVVAPDAFVRAVGDFDGDGYDDVQSFDGVYLGSPEGPASTPRWNLVGGEVMGSVAVGDVDGDGRDDVAGWDWVTREVVIWLGRDTGGDADGDGALDEADCEPWNIEVNGLATETSGDMVDQNCDGLWLCRVDRDGDGEDGSSEELQATPCEYPEIAGMRADCDDSDPSRGAGAPEVVGNEVDEDCDGMLEWLCPLDHDRDGYVVPTAPLALYRGDACPPVLGVDCNDESRFVNPGAAEEASPRDGDRNCDGLVLCYEDADGDRFGGSTYFSALPCTVAEGRDCDDTNTAIRPSTRDIAGNDVDEDCNTLFLCAHDEDGDGWTTQDETSSPCSTLPPLVVNPGDCDDDAAAVNPGVAEVAGDRLDEDCDGMVAYHIDRDGDGFGSEIGEAARIPANTFGNDCDDTNRWIGPDLPDAPGDVVDADCDGVDPFHLTAGRRALTVHGVPPRGRWWLAVSRTGPGPCVDVADGMCVDLVAPVLIGDGFGDLDGLSVRIPAGTVGYAQAIARVDGGVWRTAVVQVGGVP